MQFSRGFAAHVAAMAVGVSVALGAVCNVFAAETVTGIEFGDPIELLPDLDPEFEIFITKVSPDGNHVLIYTTAEGRTRLYLQALAGGDPSLLGTGNDFDDVQSFEFSPDSRFAVYKFMGSDRRLRLQSVDGGAPLVLETVGGGYFTDDSLYYVGKDDSGNLLSEPLDGGPSIVLATDPEGLFGGNLRLEGVVGDYVLYANNVDVDGVEVRQLFSIPVTGGEPALLSPATLKFDVNVAFSFDEATQRVAFFVRPVDTLYEYEASLYSNSVNGGSLQRVVASSELGGIRLVGSGIYMADNNGGGEIQYYYLDSGATEVVTFSDPEASRHLYELSVNLAYNYFWPSPDGQTIAYKKPRDDSKPLQVVSPLNGVYFGEESTDSPTVTGIDPIAVTDSGRVIFHSRDYDSEAPTLPIYTQVGDEAPVVLADIPQEGAPAYFGRWAFLSQNQQFAILNATEPAYSPQPSVFVGFGGGDPVTLPGIAGLSPGSDVIVYTSLDRTQVFYLPYTTTSDSDGDGIHDEIDNCPTDANPDQTDADNDNIGDVCDTFPDLDADGVEDGVDNCPTDANPDQADADNDNIGDVCDTFPDLDADGIEDGVDNCPTDANPDQADADGDNIGDVCDNTNNEVSFTGVIDFIVDAVNNGDIANNVANQLIGRLQRIETLDNFGLDFWADRRMRNLQRFVNRRERRTDNPFWGDLSARINELDGIR